MVPLPQARPQRTDLVFVRPRQQVSVAVAVQAHAQGYRFFGAAEGRSWFGASSAPNPDIAALDAIDQIRAGTDESLRLRFLVALPPDSLLWRHLVDLTQAGIWVERPSASELPLVERANLGLDGRCGTAAHRRTPVPMPLTPVTVATDGSVRRKAAGSGWLSSSGEYGLSGFGCSARAVGSKPVLVAELRAIGEAVRALGRHRLTVVTDSRLALRMTQCWMRGEDVLPTGYGVARTEGQGCLTNLREHVHAARHRIEVHWAPGHCGEPLNEGADALARLASRRLRGDADLDAAGYQSRAAGIARAFSDEFHKLNRLSA